MDTTGRGGRYPRAGPSGCGLACRCLLDDNDHAMSRADRLSPVRGSEVLVELDLQVQGRLADGTVIAASGDLDFGTAAQFGRCVEQVLQSPPDVLYVDKGLVKSPHRPALSRAPAAISARAVWGRSTPPGSVPRGRRARSDLRALPCPCPPNSGPL
jgi:hypothetical protein